VFARALGRDDRFVARLSRNSSAVSGA